MNIREEIVIKLKANTPIFQIISYEWERIFGLAVHVTEDDQRSLYRWNTTDGILKFDRTERIWMKESDQRSIIPVLEWYDTKMPNKSVLLVEDIHHYFNENFQDRARLITRLKTLARIQEKKSLIMLQPVRNLPIELDKEVYVLDIPLPTKKLISTVLDNVIDELDIPDDKVTKNELVQLAEAALGLTIQEAELTFKEIYIQEGKLSENQVPLVIARKEQIIKKSGILEYFHQQEQFSDVGGMENLKKWLKNRRGGFTQKASDMGLKPPKGVLLLGIPGCGKSLIAKAIASSWNLPLLKFDLGKVFAGIVGQSEENIRKAINIANAVAPSILWIDEIEKGLSGVGSSDMTDGGVTSRVFGTLLTWMQEKKEPVFVVATANNIAALPPELLRKGRFDEIFFVDLPGTTSRKEIWKIHLKKRLKDKYDASSFDFDLLLNQSIGYSGAEIEEAINDALYTAFAADRLLTTDDLLASIKVTYPLSKVMAEDLTKLRDWAAVRARSASIEEPDKISETKPIPKLKGEHLNMWVE